MLAWNLQWSAGALDFRYDHNEQKCNHSQNNQHAQHKAQGPAQLAHKPSLASAHEGEYTFFQRAHKYVDDESDTQADDKGRKQADQKFYSFRNHADVLKAKIQENCKVIIKGSSLSFSVPKYHSMSLKVLACLSPHIRRQHRGRAGAQLFLQKILQAFAAGGMAELAQRLRLNLPDALTGDVEIAADFLKLYACGRPPALKRIFSTLASRSVSVFKTSSSSSFSMTCEAASDGAVISSSGIKSPR